MKSNSQPTAEPAAAGDGASADTPNSPLADLVYGQILSQILSSTLKVGSKLPSENTYCEMFSVSRPVVPMTRSGVTQTINPVPNPTRKQGTAIDAFHRNSE